MNPQPRPDNIIVAAIKIITTSRWVLTSRSHSNAQTKYRTKVPEGGAGSYCQKSILEGGGRSGRVFCRRVCAAQCSLSD